jgi:hypothetical protein
MRFVRPETQKNHGWEASRRDALVEQRRTISHDSSMVGIATGRRNELAPKSRFVANRKSGG